MRGARFSIVLFVIAIGFAFPPGTARSAELIDVSPYIPKNNEPGLRPVDTVSFWCYDPVNVKVVDCRIKATIHRLPNHVIEPDDHIVHSELRDITAGKLRNITRNKSDEPREKKVLEIHDICDDREFINKDSWFDSVTVDTKDSADKKAWFQYMIPEVSGIFALQAVGGGSYNVFYYFVRYYDGFEVNRIGSIFSVGYNYLKPLEIVGDHHKIVRNGGDTHPKANFATRNTVNKIKKIAKMYHEDERGGNKLSINDMSLPWGGMFDLNNNWCAKKPNPDGTGGIGHWSHRKGTGIDINSQDIGGKAVNTAFLEDIARAEGCEPKPSSGIHYECK